MLPPSGQQFEISHGEQRATLVEVGAGIREYRVGSDQVLDRYGADEMAGAGRGQALIPWPNRLDRGAYTFGEREYQLPINEIERNCAIHGLTRWQNWTGTQLAPSRVDFHLLLHPQPGYPFLLELDIAYGLDTEGLTVTTTAANRGPDALPLGIGFHPYLAAGEGLIDSASLRLPSTTALSADERGIPIGALLDVRDSGADFSQLKSVGASRLDTCFTALERDGGGRAVAEFVTSHGRQRRLWCGREFDYLMVFTGDTLSDPQRRRGLAIEPMTCAPNAFRSGQGLRVLAAGETFSCAWGISPG